MKKKNFIFLLSTDFSFFFLKKKNTIILKKKSRFFFLKLPQIFFYKKEKNNLSFIFSNFFYFITFFKHIVHFYNKLSSFFYLRLKLKGLGYRIIIITKGLIKIFFNRSNFFYVHIPKSILLKYKIRRLFFLSTNLSELRLLMLNLLLLKKYIVYRLSGLFYPRQILLLKPGKNKFR